MVSVDIKLTQKLSVYFLNSYFLFALDAVLNPQKMTKSSNIHEKEDGEEDKKEEKEIQQLQN